MKLSEVPVRFGTVNYPVLLYENFHGLKNEMELLGDFSKLIVITEKKIASLYYKNLKDELKCFSNKLDLILIRGKEENKHVNRLKEVYNQLIRTGADRKSVILALGGGIVGDFAGFVAATYQRGIRFVQIPTTLLAAVDSSVGGKTAVNADFGKNMIGAFHQPSLVYAPLFTLATLPKKEWKCGLAEVVKHSILMGGELFNEVKTAGPEKIEPLSASVLKFITESVRYKASIVSEDERETGMRALLNLGHTAGHAIESLTNYKKYSHGEAVAIGLTSAALLSREALGASDLCVQEILDCLKLYNLPLASTLKPKKILSHMQHDKKASEGIIKYVLIRSIGDCIWGQKLDGALVLKVLQEQKKLFG